LKPSSLPVVVDQPDERHANRTALVLEWYDKHKTYHIWFKRRRIKAFKNEALLRATNAAVAQVSKQALRHQH